MHEFLGRVSQGSSVIIDRNAEGTKALVGTSERGGEGPMRMFLSIVSDRVVGTRALSDITTVGASGVYSMISPRGCAEGKQPTSLMKSIPCYLPRSRSTPSCIGEGPHQPPLNSG